MAMKIQHSLKENKFFASDGDEDVELDYIIIGNKVNIIDSGSAVARQTRKVLTKLDILQKNNPKNNVTHEFYSNKNTKVLSELLNNKMVKIVRKDF